MQIENSPFANMIWFMGVVEDIKDVKGVARVKVRAIGFHTEDRSAVSHDDLPWATFATSGADTNAPMCKPGDWVIGFFLDNTEAQQPVVLAKLHGFTPAEKDKSVGFSDPDGVFPRTTNAPTTSELARGVANTIVQYKKDTVAKKVAVADGSTWDEPATAFAAVYPQNYVIHTDGYNVLELDDTEGKERVHVFHHGGSFFEFHPNGDVVQRTLGGHFLMAYNGMRIYVNGDASVSAVGNIGLASNKSVSITAAETISLQAKDIVLGATNSITSGSKTLTLGATDAVSIAGASVAIGSSGSVTVNGSDVSLEASGSLTVAGSSLDLSASGSATLSGSSTTVQSPGSTSLLGFSGPSSPTPAIAAMKVPGSGGSAGSAGSAGNGPTGKIADVPKLTVAGYKVPYATAT